jgi:hypothetical protein
MTDQPAAPTPTTIDVCLKMADTFVPGFMIFADKFANDNKEMMKQAGMSGLNTVDMTIALMFVICFMNKSSLEDESFKEVFQKVISMTKDIVANTQIPPKSILEVN